MATNYLNLARKWRSRTFDEIIGQDLSVRILKNSLYMDQLAPVYLFSGQRGCGKTTTARVVAAAINCVHKKTFQHNPKFAPFPCLTCDSCIAMAKNHHPDFIEIDAASHTGVDHIRQIIDAASLLPLMGNKKIYLIDEAHMLSKAAFNALLKILEEPPSSVLFILATTDQHKIIDTVVSRSFQLFFRPVPEEIIVKHLSHVCLIEQVSYDENALKKIAQVTAGSLRDALNILEQIKIAYQDISVEGVHTIVGSVEDEDIFQLFASVVGAHRQKIFIQIQKLQTNSVSVSFIWHSFYALLRAALRIKCELEPLQFQAYQQKIAHLIEEISEQQLSHALRFFFQNELIMMKSIAQYDFFEMMLIESVRFFIEADDKKKTIISNHAFSHNDTTIIKKEPWESFLEALEEIHDPIMVSLFKHAKVTSSLKDSVIQVSFSKDFHLFSDQLDKTASVWKPIFHRIFGQKASMEVAFNEKDTLQKKIIPHAVHPTNNSVVKKKEHKNQKKYEVYPSKNVLDISDEKWIIARSLQSFFSGTVIEIAEEVNHG